MKRRRFLRNLALFAGVLLACDQVLQHTVLRSGTLRGKRVAPFEPPFYTEEQEDWVAGLQQALESEESARELGAYAEFDPELGWSPRGNRMKEGLYSIDEYGARRGFEPLSSRKRPEIKRVVAIGCSFTRGDEVGDLEAWPALLDQERSDLEIANLAMGAYGVGQAWLRLERDGFPLEPDEVWLGVMPTALLRCVSVYRPALRHWTAAPSWKPRFRRLESGELELIPMPLTTLDEVLAACTNQERFLETVLLDDGWCSDFWMRRALPAWRPKGSHWMHSSGLARLYLTWQDGRGRKPAKWVSNLSTEVAQTSLAICRAVAADVYERGASFRIVILPSREDLLHAGRGEEDYWIDWCDELRADGIEVFDLSATLRVAGVAAEDRAWMPGGHYAPSTNRLVAQTLAQALK